MSSIRARLRRLEARAEGAKKECPCGGPNRIRMEFQNHDEQREPDPCPKCGTVGKVIVLVRGVPPEGWPERFGPDSGGES